MAKIIIVDDLDNELGSMERDKVTTERYRVTALWLTNSKGEILLAQRALTKKISPGRWGPAVAGTIEVGETYDSNIKKEAREELDITGLAIKPLVKLTVNHEYGKSYFSQYYTATLDKPA